MAWQSIWINMRKIWKKEAKILKGILCWFVLVILISLSISWLILVDLGWSWLILNDLEWLWLISTDDGEVLRGYGKFLEHFVTFWDTVARFGTLWHVLRRFWDVKRTYWDVLDHIGTSYFNIWSKQTFPYNWISRMTNVPTSRPQWISTTMHSHRNVATPSCNNPVMYQLHPNNGQKYSLPNWWTFSKQNH